MSVHTIEFDGERFPVADYLVVQHFRFQNQERLALGRPCAVFRLVGSGFATEAARAQQTGRLPSEPNEFKVRHGDDVVLRLSDFRAHFAVTAASLDMSVVTWVLVGEPESGTVEFTPVEQRFPLFGVSEGGHSFWGGKLQERAGGELILKASLSVPTYVLHRGTRFVGEYLALGPANASGGDGTIGAIPSIFSWIVGQAGRHVRALEVADLTTGQSDFFFGKAEHDQLSPAEGAVFVMNGTILKSPWKRITDAIRTIPTRNENWEPDTREFTKWIETLPLRGDNETVEESMGRETRRAEAVAAEADFEGIMLWKLEMRRSDSEAAAMHG